jgi:hypothetical protein
MKSRTSFDVRGTVEGVALELVVRGGCFVLARLYACMLARWVEDYHLRNYRTPDSVRG